MLAAKKMNEMELNNVAGAGLDTINYILRHQNDKAMAQATLPVPPLHLPEPLPGPNPWIIPAPGPKPGPVIPKFPVA